jgi:hypothetical protein
MYENNVFRTRFTLISYNNVLRKNHIFTFSYDLFISRDLTTSIKHNLMQFSLYILIFILHARCLIYT